MARIDRDTYLRLVEAFNYIGKPVFSVVADRAKCSAGSAKTAWFEGWPDRDLLPIKPQFENRQRILEENEKADESDIYANVHLPTPVAPPKDSGARPEPVTPEVEKPPSATRQESVSIAPPTTVEGAADKIRASIATMMLNEHQGLVDMDNMLKGSTVSLTRMLMAYQTEIKGMENELAERRANPANKIMSPSATIKAVTKILVMVPKMVAARKALMEANRLGLGMPQSITETRTSGGDDEGRDQRLQAHMRQIAHAPKRGRAVIDVEATPYTGEESSGKSSTSEDE